MTKLTFENPFGAAGEWWRGNLHTHTTESDGELPPDETAARYRELGYDFLALTDHNHITEVTGVPDGLLMVPGAEYGIGEGDPVRVWHVGCVGVTPGVPADAGSPAELHASVREHAAFSWVAHPYWSNLPEDEFAAFEGFDTTEVYNAVTERVIDRGYSDAAWDYALASGVRINALAVDDAHSVHDFGRGWIMLRAEKLDLDAVYEALRRGHYYATSGPEIHDLTIEDDVVRVRCSRCRTIKFMAGNWRGAFISAPEGDTVTSAEYEITGDEVYVRVQVEDAAGRRAYANPIYVERTEEGD